MKYRFIPWCIILTMHLASAQTLETIFEEVQAARKAGLHDQVIRLAEQWRIFLPEQAAPYEALGYAHLQTGRYNDAIGFYTKCLWLDPAYPEALTGLGQALALSGKIKEAGDAYAAGFQFLNPERRTNALADLDAVCKQKGLAPLGSTFSAWISNPLQLTSTAAFRKSMLESETYEQAAEKAHVIMESYTQAGRHDLVLHGYNELHVLMQNNGRYSDALAAARQGYTHMRKYGNGKNSVQAARLLTALLNTYRSLENYEAMGGFAQELLELLDHQPIPVYTQMAMNLMTDGYFQSGNYAENMQWARTTYYRAMQAEPSVLQFHAALNTAIAYGLQNIPEGPQRSVEFAQAAVQLAIRLKLEHEIPNAMSILAIRLIALGTNDGFRKGNEILGQTAALMVQRGDTYGAANTLNNAGVVLYSRQQYAQAIPILMQAADLSRQALSKIQVQATDKLTLYKQQTDIQTWIAICHARLGQAAGAFEAMERSRAVVLRERMGETGPPIKLAEFQSLLNNDEAALFYVKFSGHEVAILTVTSKYASVAFHADDSFIGDIKDKYLDRIKKEHESRRGPESTEPINRDLRVSHQDFSKVVQLTRRFFENPGTGDDVLQDFLNGYYRFLILPVLNRLTGFKKLLISPDMEYNLLPFEALRSGDGKYLGEKFDIRYIPSGSLMRDIRKRHYPASRDPLLAMGGAKFSDLKTTAYPLNSAQDLNQLRIEVEVNQAAGKSQRAAYAALFGTQAMHELPGTVAEVQQIGKTVPGSKVYIGAEMSEPKIKAMAASGELARYKILHLATHGFVVDPVPELSGVAMTIGPEEDHGEDGFLNVSELSKLGLKTDLTVLSACQTALGKIYAGEGVSGLTHSLLAAGSNAALVSLWPVNDNSTMLFMSAFYQEVKKGKPYPQIVSELKRKFIKGEFGAEYRHPNFWAPFIYIGD